MKWIQQHSNWANRAAALCVIGAIAVILCVLPIRGIAGFVESTALRLGAWGFVVYALAYVTMSVLSIPVWAMPFIAGAMFGTVAGTILSSASCIVSAAVCFLIARRLRTTWLRKWLESSPRFRALERAIAEGDWKMVVAVRVSHFLTFGMQNYAFGLTNIRFWPYLLATWAVTFPGIMLQAYLGHLGYTGLDEWQAESASWQVWLMRIGGFAIMATAVMYLGYRLRLAYRESFQDSLSRSMQTESTADLGGAVVNKSQ